MWENPYQKKKKKKLKTWEINKTVSSIPSQLPCRHVDEAQRSAGKEKCLARVDVFLSTAVSTHSKQEGHFQILSMCYPLDAVGLECREPHSLGN